MFHCGRSEIVLNYPEYSNVRLVKIEGPVTGAPSIIIYLLYLGFYFTLLLINQPMGKGHLWAEISRNSELGRKKGALFGISLGIS